MLGSGHEGQEPLAVQLGFWSRWPRRCSREDSEVVFENKVFMQFHVPVGEMAAVCFET